MKTNKKMLTAMVAIMMVLFTASVSAMWNGQGQGNWQGRGQWQGQKLQNWTGDGNSNHEIVDTNNNGIADGQEDWDNDGILNKDDEDYEKSNVNMKDDDWDGIPNKDDEDYVKPQDGTGNKNGNWMKKGSGSMDWSGSLNGKGKWNKTQSKYLNNTKKIQYKNIIKDKYQSKIDWMTEDKKIALLDKIDELEEKIENSTTYSDDKKEQYITLLEALKETVSESLETEDEVNIDDLLQ